jgi:hypothetical protein
LWWGRIPASPAAFSPTTNCSQWLQDSGEVIIYNYGVNDTSSGARALRDCLQREDAARSREGVREILIAFPSTGQPDHKQQPLLDLVHILPNLKSVRYVAFETREI